MRIIDTITLLVTLGVLVGAGMAWLAICIGVTSVSIPLAFLLGVLGVSAAYVALRTE